MRPQGSVYFLEVARSLEGQIGLTWVRQGRSTDYRVLGFINKNPLLYVS